MYSRQFRFTLFYYRSSPSDIFLLDKFFPLGLTNFRSSFLSDITLSEFSVSPLFYSKSHSMEFYCWPVLDPVFTPHKQYHLSWVVLSNRVSFSTHSLSLLSPTKTLLIPTWHSFSFILNQTLSRCPLSSFLSLPYLSSRRFFFVHGCTSTFVVDGKFRCKKIFVLNFDILWSPYKNKKDHY